MQMELGASRNFHGKVSISYKINKTISQSWRQNDFWGRSFNHSAIAILLASSGIPTFMKYYLFCCLSQHFELDTFFLHSLLLLYLDETLILQSLLFLFESLLIKKAVGVIAKVAAEELPSIDWVGFLS